MTTAVTTAFSGVSFIHPRSVRYLRCAVSVAAAWWAGGILQACGPICSEKGGAILRRLSSDVRQARLPYPHPNI